MFSQKSQEEEAMDRIKRNRSEMINHYYNMKQSASKVYQCKYTRYHINPL